jgi:hypothetical protein
VNPKRKKALLTKIGLKAARLAHFGASGPDLELYRAADVKKAVSMVNQSSPK